MGSHVRRRDAYRAGDSIYHYVQNADQAILTTEEKGLAAYASGLLFSVHQSVSKRWSGSTGLS
jgi:hypothetical protein